MSIFQRVNVINKTIDFCGEILYIDNNIILDKNNEIIYNDELDELI